MRYVLLLVFFSLTAGIQFSENSEPDPLPNVVATPCSTNLPNLWLDVVLVTDVSNSVLPKDLDRLGTILIDVFNTTNIGNSTKHTTRVGIINYYSGYSVQYYLTTVSNTSKLTNFLSNYSRFHTSSSGGYLAQTLDYVRNMFNNYRSYRPKAVILFDSSYPTSDPVSSANNLKNMGVSIITIADGGAHSNLSDKLAAVATSGMNFSLIDPYLPQKIKSSLLTVNCFCPASYYQMKTVDTATNTITLYADCLYGYSGDTDPAIAQQFCEPDILVPVTSLAKLDFITDSLVPTEMPGAKNFTTGAVRIGGYWYWQDYNNTQYRFGSFPSTTSATGGNIGYFSSTYGFNWQFLGGGSGSQYARPFICQTYAYDADHMREFDDS